MQEIRRGRRCDMGGLRDGRASSCRHNILWTPIAATVARTHTNREGTLFLEAVLWRVRIGSLWRDLLEYFGNWNSVFRRFRRWAKAGVFERIFKEINGLPDCVYEIIGCTIEPDWV